MSAADSWSAWRESQVEADERDIPAREAYLAGWKAADMLRPAPAKPWHESASAVLIVAIVVAAICYFLAGAPH